MNTPNRDDAGAMNPAHILFGLGLLAAALPAWPAEPVLRQTLNINREWKFLLGDHPGAELPAYDDIQWADVHLPHSFGLPYFLSPRFYLGYGWYRKVFEVPAAWQGKCVFVEFAGAYREAEVFVNGQSVGRNRSGYTGFSLEISGAVHPGRNVLAVRLNNLFDPTLAPRGGDHMFNGGIYRDVCLVVTDPVHVAWYGTFASTPQVSREAATVNVKTEVVNAQPRAAPVTVTTEVVDAQGATVACMQSIQTLAAGQTLVFDQTSAAIAKPQLWSPQTPYLYSVRTTVGAGGKAVDDYVTPLGIRWFKFTPDQGFFLNGEHYYFRGANVHQDQAGWGDAVTHTAIRRDVAMMKAAGFDFIRGSHYPHHPVFSDACDRLGLLFWSENDFWAAGGSSPDGHYNSGGAYPVEPEYQAAFEESVLEHLRTMIRIHRNHPSIIVWSTSNEPFFTESATLPKVRGLLQKEVALGHELDPTRPIAIGGAQRGGIDKLGDLAGYNGDGASMTEYLNPGVPSVVSEYSSTITDRPGKFEPGWGDLPRGAGQDPSQKYPWHYPWRSGEAIWCGFDHGTVCGYSLATMGLVDYFRLPKRAYYWYRQEYAGVPAPEERPAGKPAALRLSADKTSIVGTDGTDDVFLVVSVVDAAGRGLKESPPVTLTVESGPAEFPTGPSITFAPRSDIAIRDGLAAITCRSYYAGMSVIRASSPGLTDATIAITTTGTPAFVPGSTPAVKPRPYVRYEGRAKAGQQLRAFGLNNPTRASSEAPGHSRRLANDGDPATSWQADPADPTPWWQVDFERVLTVAQVKLRFPDDSAYGCRIEVSEHGDGDWKLLADSSLGPRRGKEQTFDIHATLKCRVLRVTFTRLPAGKPAGLAEFNVMALFAEG